MKIKVLVYPKDNNPYQALLYGPMTKLIDRQYLTDITPSKTINNLLLLFLLIYYRTRGFRIFHLHWAYGFTFPGVSRISLYISTIYYYFILSFIKICGYKIVWTVHNVIPHLPLFINDLEARKFLAKIATIKIIHSPSTIDELKKLQINSDHSRIIPIGNFIGVYPSFRTEEEARKLLSLKVDSFVFLFFGKFEAYKGVERLLKVFSDLRLENVHLMIAGGCSDVELRKKMDNYRGYSNITIDDHFIADDQVQNYFKAADMVVYPFEKITTSSSVLLAFSFKKSIIYPRIGNLVDLPKDIGFAYDPDDTNGLKKSLLIAIESKKKLPLLNSQAYKYAKSLDWKIIAQKTADVYLEMVG